MKKGILCLLLSLLMLVPAFASCTQTADLTGEEAKVYTLYTIVDEKTTDEAINQVELALNRIVFYRLGVILNLEMVTEAEYDQLIEDKFEEMEELQLSKKNQKKEESSVDGEEVSEDIMTGDRILDILEEGGDVPMEDPRLDIFLVRGYDKYYELAKNGDLAALDEKLSNEAKSLKSSIHSTLFNAAKVDSKTYGVPVNNAIGEYTYLVFDKALLEKYSIDPNTLRTLEDLQDYLKLIKDNEADVVPLKNTAASTEINFLGIDGFPALVSKKTVVDAYSNIAVKDYISMIARYNALGYIGAPVEEGTDDSNRYAVRIESGNPEDIEARLGGEGQYSFSLYSAPVAANENTIDNIFCISKFAASNELTDIMKIVTAINTDAQLMNLLTYGIENEHYILTDEGQVERLNENYIVNPYHIGNCFISYTLKGENPNKWANAVKQNQDAIVSPSLGFTSSLYKFNYSEMVEIEDPENPGEMITQKVNTQITEPDYIAIINTVVEKYWPALMSGNAVEFNYTELLARANNEIKNEFIKQLDEHYEKNILQPTYADKVRDQITASRGPALKQEAEESIQEECRNKVIASLETKLTDEYKLKKPNATDDEIRTMLDETITEDYINEHFADYFTESAIQVLVDGTYNSLLEGEINQAVAKVIGTPAYVNEFNKLKNSAKYKDELNKMLAYDAPAKVIARVDSFIAEQLVTYTDTIKAECSTAIEAEIKKFVEENAEKLDLTEEEILLQIGYLIEEEVESEDDEAEEDDETSGEEDKPTVIRKPKYETWFEFVFENEIKSVYYQIFGDPTK